MSDNYTPTVEDVRDRYADARAGVSEWTRSDDSVRAVEEAYEEFDRMIASVRADALEAATRVPVQGEPSEAQVEAAAKAIADCHNPGMFEKYPDNWRVEARASLVAAASAAQVQQVSESDLAEVAARALEEAAVGIFVSPASADAVYDALRARAAKYRKAVQ